MLYPVYVHKDEGTAFGITVPDFPGCFSAADNWDDLPVKVREAVELYCDGESLAIPTPGNIEAYANEKEYTDGQWVYVEINTAELNTKAVRINISLPENLISQIDQRAKAQGMSRSGFLSVAASKELARL
ncbi:MAG: type II toxin-antitoxin system HicB family antitoxin [Pseudomonadales bacterium]